MEKGRFPNKLKMFRRCQGYSQKKVARLLSLGDTSLISRWEHGKTIPSLVHLFRLAKVYQTQPHELYEELWDQILPDSNLLAQNDEPFTINEPFYV